MVEIAAYLNRDVTTVQRWEEREAMPVHRHLHDRLGSVYAIRAELDAWAAGWRLKNAEETEEAPSVSVLDMPAQAGQVLSGRVSKASSEQIGAETMGSLDQSHQHLKHCCARF